MARGKRKKTRYEGVGYREHDTRTDSSGRKDRWFFIRYRIPIQGGKAGRQVEESIGWASQGWNAIKARDLLASLREAHKTGIGPQTLREQREVEAQKRQAKEEAEAQEKLNNLTIQEIWPQYLAAQEGHKSARSIAREKDLWKLIEPIIGHFPLKDVSLINLEKIKQQSRKLGHSPRSQVYHIVLVRQLANWAISHGLYNGKNPVSSLKPAERKKLLKFGDNRRRRFLTEDEAGRLLALLKKRSQKLYEISLTSILTGARASEVFSLCWKSINFEAGTLDFLDTKGGVDRTVPIPNDLLEVLKAKKRGKPDELVFPKRGGGTMEQVGGAFRRAVNDLDLNNGIEDRRQRVSFHTLRHTYASWLVMAGTSLFDVKELLGHADIGTTDIYSHLAPDHLQSKVEVLNGKVSLPKEETEAETQDQAVS